MSEDDVILKEKSEMGEIFDNLDSDVKDDKGMSSIDFNSRLKERHLIAITRIEELKRMGIYPKNLTITHQFKRNTVSLNGMGRLEKVQIAAANREMNAGLSFGDKIKAFLGGKKE